MEIILTWIQNNVAESIAILISLSSLVLTSILSRREMPNFMPSGQNVSQGNHLSFDFLNTSQFNLHNVTVLINGFDEKCDELRQVDIMDKYLFVIGEKSSFHYGFVLGEYAKKPFYVRVRFKGDYRTRVPFVTRTFKQELWYSVIPIAQVDNGVAVKVANTHKDEIEKIQAKHTEALKNYDRRIDKKFS